MLLASATPLIMLMNNGNPFFEGSDQRVGSADRMLPESTTAPAPKCAAEPGNGRCSSEGVLSDNLAVFKPRLLKLDELFVSSFRDVFVDLLADTSPDYLLDALFLPGPIARCLPDFLKNVA